MSAQNAPADDAGAQMGGIEDARSLLEQALAILDSCNAAAELRARLHEVIEGLEESSN
jgi:hypothetical protein